MDPELKTLQIGAAFQKPIENRKNGSFLKNWGAAENEVQFQNLLQESFQLSPPHLGFHLFIQSLRSAAGVNTAGVLGILFTELKVPLFHLSISGQLIHK